MTRFAAWLRARWQRLMQVERTADDLPEHHDGPAPSDTVRTLPPGGAAKL